MDYPTATGNRNSAMNRPPYWRDRSGENVTLLMAGDISSAIRNGEKAEFTLRIPRHWKPEPGVNDHAASIEPELIAWFRDLGFDDHALVTIRSFAPGHYAGAPFPRIGREELLRLARYLSLWLLWDDVDVESNDRGFQLRSAHIFGPNTHRPSNLYDKAWWSLFRELAREQTPTWIEMLLESMHVWSAAALSEARIVRSRRGAHVQVSFAEAMQLRMATIGMSATTHLVEYARHIEVSREFHEHPTVRKIKKLSDKIVGIGNDLLSLGKDLASDYANIVVALADEMAVSLREAIRCVVRMHDEALLEFDRLAASLPSFGSVHDDAIAVWLGDLRYACIGFTLWEARAPRYAKCRVLLNGAHIEPCFSFYSGGASSFEDANGESEVRT